MNVQRRREDRWAERLLWSIPVTVLWGVATPRTRNTTSPVLGTATDSNEGLVTRLVPRRFGRPQEYYLWLDHEWIHRRDGGLKLNADYGSFGVPMRVQRPTCTSTSLHNW
ncbi:hypothetical protein KM043_012386 [Ampulex compressa]|nr:hypothetical protein KM043_012386 [Ampulex compressa]